MDHYITYRDLLDVLCDYHKQSRSQARIKLASIRAGGYRFIDLGYVQGNRLIGYNQQTRLYTVSR